MSGNIKKDNDNKSFSYAQTEDKDKLLTAKCIVHFRPKADWKGIGYGFDWMRLADTGMFGDMKYEKIVSKQYTDTKKLEKNRNEYRGHFDPTTPASKKLYEALKLEYKPLTISWKVDTEDSKQYFCSWLSLFPETVGSVRSNYSNTEAELRLYLDVKEAPDYLEFETNNNFEITPKTIKNNLGKGLRYWGGGKTIKIKCKKEFREDQKINIYAIKKDKITEKDVKELAGRLYVWANYASRRKKRKVVFVRVKTSVSKVPPEVSGEKQRIERYLRQALLELDSNSVEVLLDVSNQADFKGFIDAETSAIQKTSGKENLKDYLNKKLKDTKKGAYDNYFKAFYFAENGTVNGYTEFGADFTIAFGSRNQQTVAHEFLHTLNLPHSFTNIESSKYAKYTYKSTKTDNLLDYSHLDIEHKNDRCALWYWQWKIASDTAQKNK